MEQWQYTALAWTTIGLIIASAVYFIPKDASKSKPVATKWPNNEKPVTRDLPSNTSKSQKASKTVKQKDSPANTPAPAEPKPEKKKKSKNNAKQVPTPTSTIAKAAPAVVESYSDESEDSDNREWARRAALARSGVTLKADSKSKSGQRTVKQSLASGALTAGTPEVADMLPEPTSAPNVVRIIVSDKPAKPAAPARSSTPPAETKKQRQNRRKAEERRQANEDAAKEQAALQEQQRRRAREARGEPAKDGSRFLAEIDSNAWNSNTAAVTPEPAPEPLLDTFDSTLSTNGSTENDDGWLQVGKKKIRKERDDGAATPNSRESQDAKANASQVSSAGHTYMPPTAPIGLRHTLDSAWIVE